MLIGRAFHFLGRTRGVGLTANNIMYVTNALTSRGPEGMGQFVEGRAKRHCYNFALKESIFHTPTLLIKLFNFSFSLEIKC